MAHAHTEQLIDAWRLSRGGLRLPARTAIRPESIGALLPQVFVLGQGDDGSWRFRLAGSFIVGLFGRELRGADFLDLWDLLDRTEADASLARAQTDSEPAVLKALAISGEGRAMGLEMTLAPATGPSLHADRVVGLMQPTGRAPHLFDGPVASLRFAGRERRPVALRLVVDNISR